MPKIIHIADTHLGRSTFQKTASDGINYRESCIEENFLAAAESIIDKDPDLVVHAGDLFDTVKPKTRSIMVAMKFMDILKEAGIPLAIVEGNHSMPKNSYTQSVFEILHKAHPEVYMAYSFKYQHFEVAGVELHSIPNMLCPADYLKAASEAAAYNKENPYTKGDRPHILITHGMASTIQDNRLASIIEFELTPEVLCNSYDYIALGHYHGMAQVGPKAWYPGSTEYLTYGEVGDVKGGLEVEVGGGGTSVKHLYLPNSPMFDAGAINCENMRASDIGSEIDSRIKLRGGKCDQMYQIELDYGASQIITPDQEVLKQIRESILDLKIVVRNKEIEETIIGDSSHGAINYIDEFPRFVDQRFGNSITGSRKAQLSEKGQITLRTVISRHIEVPE